MKLVKHTLLFGAALIIITSCNPLKKIESNKQSAYSNYSAKNYTQAYSQFDALITTYHQNNMSVPNDLYLKAASAADFINKKEEAIKYYQSALSDSITLTGVKGLVASLEKDNKTTDIQNALTEYETFLIDNNQSGYLYGKLYEIAQQNNDQNKIIELYSKLDNSNEDQSFAYLKALEEKGNKKEAVKFCNQTILSNPSYLSFKEWKANYYYEIAENWYKSEMDKYNKDKNYTAYVYLKRELKKISANYRISKGLFEELHDKRPVETKYIKYLKNIYLRLDMKNEAAAMDKLLK